MWESGIENLELGIGKWREWGTEKWKGKGELEMTNGEEEWEREIGKGEMENGEWEIGNGEGRRGVANGKWVIENGNGYRE